MSPSHIANTLQVSDRVFKVLTFALFLIIIYLKIKIKFLTKFLNVKQKFKKFLITNVAMVKTKPCCTIW